MPRSRASLRWWFACACAALAAYEGWTVFVRTTPALVIEGAHTAPVRQFGEGTPVAQTFRMIGNELDAIAVQFSSETPANLLVQCDLLETSPGPDRSERVLHSWSTTIKRVSGVEWRRLELPPLASSHRRTLMLRLQLIGAAAVDTSIPLEMRNLRPEARPQVAVIASTDNVFGGGMLWVGEHRETGSLSLRAYTRRRTAYQRYRAEVAPALPPILRSGAVAVLLAVAYQWALLTVIYRLIADALTAREPRAAIRPQAL
jgi:hypothetical protein